MRISTATGIAKFHWVAKKLNVRYADNTTLLANTNEQMAELLQRVKHFKGETDLKLNRSKCCIMAGNTAA